MAGYETQKSAAELERELDHDRGDIARKVEALQGKLSVGAMIDDALHGARQGGGAFGSNLGRTIADNPVPVMLIGAGLAWLATGGGGGGRRVAHADVHHAPDPLTPRGPIPASAPRPYDATGEHGGARIGEAARRGLGGAASSASGAADATAGAASSAASTASGGAARAAQASREGAYSAARGLGSAAEIARERARSGYESGVHGLEAAGGYASGAARSAARGAGRLGHEARSGFDELLDEQPLVVGALAFAVGAAVGALVPNTRREDRLFGESAERAREEVYGAARDEAEKARRVAEAAIKEGRSEAEGALREVDERTPSASEAVKEGESRAKDAARRVGDAARAEADRQEVGRPQTSPH